MNFYVLPPDGPPVPEPDVLKWAAWMETADRWLALDHVGEARVSTVFLGIDHGWREGGPPVLFETMVFGGPLDGEQERYASRGEAREGHAKMLRRVRESH